MEQRQSEWQQLQANALAILERPQQYVGLDIPRGLRPALRVWHFPSFSEHSAWLVFRRSPNTKSGISLVQEFVWDRAEDYKRMSDPLVGIKHPLGFVPTPHIRTRAVEVSDDQITSRLNSLADLDFKPFVEDRPFGLDGETFGIELLDAFNGARFAWWCDGPDDWAALTQWTKSSIKFFKQCLAGVESTTGEVRPTTSQ